jgi:SAM-dependent methyltransferase
MHPSQRVNYDAIAHLYDEPGRDHDLDPNLLNFLNEQTSLRPTDLRILDMGCGMGKQLCSNQAAFHEARTVGLDLFIGMLRQAQKRCIRVAWIQGSSAQTPFPSSSFHYITNQYSYPHVLDKSGMIAETFRVLAPGGRFVMTNIDPWSMPGWLIYQYFPTSRERDFKDFMPAEKFTAMLERAGFTSITVSRQQRQVQRTLKELQIYASRRYRTSQLIVISDDDYEAGLARIAQDMNRIGETTLLNTELCWITIIGDKPL